MQLSLALERRHRIDRDLTLYICYRLGADQTLTPFHPLHRKIPHQTLADLEQDQKQAREPQDNTERIGLTLDFHLLLSE